MSAKDPFYLVKEEIQDSVNKAQANQVQIEQLQIGSSERARLLKELSTTCDSIEWQLEELDRAISVAEKDPVRFSVDSAEIERRRRWTISTRTQIGLVKRELQSVLSERAPGHQREAQRRELLRAPDGARPGPRPNEAIMRDNEDFIAGEDDRQALIMRTQDEHLDEMSESLAKIGGMGIAIHEELGSQDKIISELQADVENTNSRLELVQKKMTAVMKKAGIKGQLMMIVALVVLFLILLALLVYT